VKEETSITGATPKSVFLFLSDSYEIASEKTLKLLEIWPCLDTPGTSMMEFILERVVTEIDYG
jgi:hypothetical protein